MNVKTHGLKPGNTRQIRLRVSLVAEIKVPTIPGAGAKLSIGRWFKRVGDPVTVHEPLVEIDTDNVTHEILTPVTGVLAAILVKDGGSVEPGTLLALLNKFDRTTRLTAFDGGYRWCSNPLDPHRFAFVSTASFRYDCKRRT